MTAINWSNITDFSSIPAAANTVSGGSFWVGMLFMSWIIIMLISISYGFEVSILVSSFAALVIGLLLTYSGLIAWQWVMTFAGIIVVMFLYIIWSSGKQQ